MPNPNVGLHAAFAATCNPAYYLENGTCYPCNPAAEAYYCPGDDRRHPCPTGNADYTQFGYHFLSGGEAAWAGVGAASLERCRSYMDFSDDNGNVFHLEDAWNGTAYWTNDPSRFLWYSAAAGYYLSPYRDTTWRVWYHGVKECTNAPAHAHYTGAGTPDSPDGTVVDANDCPWECDAGYRQVGDTCQALCAAGVTFLHAGTAMVTLWAAPHTSPALGIRTSGGVCYGNLIPGRSAGINITANGMTYHLE